MARRGRNRKNAKTGSELAVYLDNSYASDADERLHRAYDLILRAAAAATEQTAEQPAEELSTRETPLDPGPEEAGP